MKSIPHVDTSFYQNLGKLFYAIAAADTVVRDAEYKSLHEIVQTAWLSLDDIEDEFGTDAAYQIEIVFDWLHHKELTAEACFKAFESYYKEHSTLFNIKVKSLILETSHRIANAFSGKNKSELILLSKLQLLFTAKLKS